ncbi:MFS transporter [Klebsiella pneumoniae]|uniref:MFS transporter n=1 Tax=Klebsiella pneumoniae TaxID=573 RepID=UPI001AEBBCE2|nr:MFS transporter [Klebsiella pneumoniae]QTQ21966.1 MFS transporter [Klebsiella pneumoniae]QTQ27272.1 MFS transporter [Klebsiella pneumoniae]
MSALGHTRAHWSGVLAMTLCVFVLIASEFMPVSLLTPIAGDLHITEGLAGQGIALSGALAVLAFVWQCISLPSMKSPRAPQRQGSVLRLFRLSTLSLGLLACGLFFMGQFTLFTYVRPFLETVTQVSPSGLSLILLTMGIAGFIGTLLITTVLNARFYPTLVAIPLLMAAIAGTLLLAGHHTGSVAVLLSLWGLLATAAPTGWWTWIARTLPEDAETGGGLMVAVIQLSIALGSTVGGLVFDSLGWHSTFALSGLLLLGAAGVTFLLSVKIRSSQRTAINELNA